MENMSIYINKAKTLIEALPYIKEFAGITVVVKYGGSALNDGNVKNTVMQDIVLMKYVGFKPVIVHGGGPEINDMLSKLNIKSQFVDGLRVTDSQTMEIAEMVLAGKVNKAIAAELTAQGVSAVGVSGKDAGLLKVEKMCPHGRDIGFVGTVTEVNNALITTLIENDFIPVISTIGTDTAGQTYNINADYAAVAIAGSLKAEKLVFLTDTPGVLRDVNDKKTVFPRIRLSEIAEMVADGRISGGMIPKVQSCADAIRNGVRNVHILDGRIEHCLILEIFTPDGIGTLVER